MPPELKLVISQNNKILQTIKSKINDEGLVKSIEDFKIIANSSMTKLIEDSGDSGDCNMDEEAENSENDEDGLCVSPKKKKK